MCGIVGITWRDPELVERMKSAIEHRGPDGHGTWADEHVTLGHRRLTILDLSERGAQPMTRAFAAAGGRELVVTYNGEIYNFRELRAELEGAGYAFTSDSDTEVLLAAYAHWGTDCVTRFHGMWAFALWDAAERKLVLSRDRFGKKPLYFRLHDGRRHAGPGGAPALSFASEIKALLADPACPRRPNERIVADYLYRGIAGHSAQTFFEGIECLPASHTGVFDVGTGAWSVERYFDLPVGDRKVGFDEIREALSRAVERRLVSDVPVSLSLSGGIDSSAIAAVLASGHPDERYTAFTTMSGESKGDETHLVKQLIERYPNLTLKTNPLAPDSFLENYRAIIHHMDEPFVGQVPYVRWEIARTCRENGFKVILNGEGADELAGGYWISIAYFLSDLFKGGRMLRLVRELRALAETKELGTVVPTFLAVALLPAGIARRQGDKRYAAVRERFGLRPHWGDTAAEIAELKGVDGKHMLKKLATEKILPHLLNCNDKMSMANSVEARAPFLDHELATLLMSIPAGDMVVDGRRKHPLRESVRGLVPDTILDRRSKDYFAAPTRKYLRDERMSGRARELFADARSACFLDPAKVLAEYDAYLAKQSKAKNFLLRSLWLEEWMRLFDVAA